MIGTKVTKQESRQRRGIRVATIVASGAVAAGGMFFSAGAASASPMPEAPTVSTAAQHSGHGHWEKHCWYHKHHKHGHWHKHCKWVKVHDHHDHWKDKHDRDWKDKHH
ncbi:hypothetical protein I2W78_12030 [Streptomyces spinoverrucosus]|uniref:hypothetical protein n=1 Tax=Streptomyces spinoverrucosus TaxID=284043 RepID=UPI0018C428F6|nr:hypothetical protein [Streptomyces spinoverrucosus]MBG0852546.1 hypothetical protein [Streptomyces spinoverrucosus]